jgi:hypothetical protein
MWQQTPAIQSARDELMMARELVRIMSEVLP